MRHILSYNTIIFFFLVRTISFGQLNTEASILLLEGREKIENFDSLLQQFPESKWVALSGKVWDSDLQIPFMGADISIIGTEVSSFTDLEGYFYMVVPRSKDTFIIQISSLYCTSQFPIVPSHSMDSLVFKMNVDCRVSPPPFKSIPK